jgi:hypothetical protein
MPTDNAARAIALWRLVLFIFISLAALSAVVLVEGDGVDPVVATILPAGTLAALLLGARALLGRSRLSHHPLRATDERTFRGVVRGLPLASDGAFILS